MTRLSSRLWTALFVLALAMFGFATPAWADAKSDAAALKAQGDQEMDHLNFQKALEDYEKAYQLSKDPALLYNRARALQSLNRMPEAVEQLEQFDREAPADMKSKVPQLPQMLAEFRSRVGVITIDCPEVGARVLVNGRVIGTTPLPSNTIRVNAGQSIVEVTEEGYDPFRTEINVVPTGTTVKVKLVRKTTVLVVTATPPALESVLDGKAGPGTPMEVSVAPGKHTVLLTRPGYYDLQTATVVAPGERKSLDVNFEYKPITARWWFWTGVVAVVAAGVIIPILAASIERGADRGDIEPFIVRAP
jgi:hypothetical protein